MRLTWSIAVLAAAIFFPLFIIRGIAGFDFWWWISANIALLLGIVAMLDETWRREIAVDIQERLLWKIGMGVLSAAVLYGVFFTGNIVSRRLFFFAGTGIDAVYAFKTEASPLRIGLLMLCLIGPGEELFWRGFLQRHLQKGFGQWRGFFMATMIYTLIHVGSGNVMLVLAAGVCGLFWGFLYLRFHSMLLNAISHTLWDVAIFLILPVI
jgi:membrane protease YdiL (CAAX protease family)